MHFLQAINSDVSVLIVCNKTGGTIKGDIKKILESFNQYNCSIIDSCRFTKGALILSSLLRTCLCSRYIFYECCNELYRRNVTVYFV